MINMGCPAYRQGFRELGPVSDPACEPSPDALGMPFSVGA